ncbi:MAG: transporter substrate-binding domain-containing protein [Spirochaetaceae bacterium]
MKKLSIIVTLIFLLLGCSKKGSELEISENAPETIKETVTEELSVDSDEKKPLLQITKEDSLQIMVRADGAPGMYLDTDGSIKGFYVDLEKAVMKEMGQKYDLVAYTDLGPLLQNLKSGASHSALATPILPDYKAFLNISDGYEILDFVIFLPSDSTIDVPNNKEDAIKTLYGKKVGVQTRGHIYQVLRDHKDIEIIEYPTTTVAMEALNNGEVDAVPEVKRIGIHYGKINNWNVKPVGAPIFGLDIGTGFSQALDTSVLDRYNTALNALIDSGYVDKLYNDYFGQ